MEIEAENMKNMSFVTPLRPRIGTYDSSKLSRKPKVARHNPQKRAKNMKNTGFLHRPSNHVSVVTGATNRPAN
jgi:hypothetical protein